MEIHKEILKEHPELYEFLQVYRYASERCVPRIESKLVGIARYMNLKYIKKGKHLHKIAREHQVFINRNKTKYRLTKAGMEVLSRVIKHPYQFIPVQLRFLKKESEIDRKYYLDGYFLEKDGQRVPYTLVYHIKIIFLKDGGVCKALSDAEDVILTVRNKNRECIQEFNIDNPIKVEAYPTIAYLFWFVAIQLENIRDSTLRYLVAKFGDRLFRNVKEVDLANSKLWKIETPYGGIMICPKCISNKCKHIVEIIVEKRGF